MNRLALTIEEQIALLRKRGMTVDNVQLARDVLSNIGYFRLSFYLFPFEKTYPDRRNRTHEYIKGTTFEDAVRLYSFDFELRNILLKFISHIEVNLRTVLTYEGSMWLQGNTTWFVDEACVDADFVSSFKRVVYNKTFRNNPAIKEHHLKYKHDEFAPAWKTIEYMTLGENIMLYKAILNPCLRTKIANRFGIRYIEILENYLETLRSIRNASAHGAVLFDFRPATRIKKGPAGLSHPQEYQNLFGCIRVVRYMLRHVWKRREDDMVREIQALLDKYNLRPQLAHILKYSAGFPRRL